jgi:hypothetical protein
MADGYEAVYEQVVTGGDRGEHRAARRPIHPFPPCEEAAEPASAAMTSERKHLQRV